MIYIKFIINHLHPLKRSYVSPKVNFVEYKSTSIICGSFVEVEIEGYETEKYNW